MIEKTFCFKILFIAVVALLPAPVVISLSKAHITGLSLRYGFKAFIFFVFAVLPNAIQQ
ncbi:membrane protein [Candidatus Magnetoovum chiemensis]|nr:membrane protein [Candidatus Magnetoovum chiemensis]